MQVDPEQIVKEDASVASLPDIYFELEQAIDSPGASFEQIGDIISSDPALAARMLKLANSALFSIQNPVDSIYTAISVIGTQQLRELALATIVMDSFEGVDHELVNMLDFWRHSIGCGVAARVLATYRRENNVERFYLMGLFHDVGRILLLSQLTEKEANILIQAEQEDLMVHHLEQKSLGFDHAEISARLLQLWHLPNIQQEAVRYHHRPLEAPEELIAACIVHVADWIAHGLNYGSSGEHYVPPLDETAWEHLNIPVSALETIVDHASTQYKEVVDLFLKTH